MNRPKLRIATDSVQLGYLFDGLRRLREQRNQWPNDWRDALPSLRRFSPPSGYEELDLGEEGIVLLWLQKTERRYPIVFVSDYLYYRDGVDACGLKGIMLMTAPNRLYRNAVNVVTMEGISETLEYDRWAHDPQLASAMSEANLTGKQASESRGYSPCTE